MERLVSPSELSDGYFGGFLVLAVVLAVVAVFMFARFDRASDGSNTRISWHWYLFSLVPVLTLAALAAYGPWPVRVVESLHLLAPLVMLGLVCVLLLLVIFVGAPFYGRLRRALGRKRKDEE